MQQIQGIDWVRFGLVGAAVAVVAVLAVWFGSVAVGRLAVAKATTAAAAVVGFAAVAAAEFVGRAVDALESRPGLLR